MAPVMRLGSLAGTSCETSSSEQTWREVRTVFVTGWTSSTSAERRSSIRLVTRERPGGGDRDATDDESCNQGLVHSKVLDSTSPVVQRDSEKIACGRCIPDYASAWRGRFGSAPKPPKQRPGGCKATGPLQAHDRGGGLSSAPRQNRSAGSRRPCVSARPQSTPAGRTESPGTLPHRPYGTPRPCSTAIRHAPIPGTAA